MMRRANRDQMGGMKQESLLSRLQEAGIADILSVMVPPHIVIDGLRRLAAGWTQNDSPGQCFRRTAPVARFQRAPDARVAPGLSRLFEQRNCRRTRRFRKLDQVRHAMAVPEARRPESGTSCEGDIQGLRHLRGSWDSPK